VGTFSDTLGNTLHFKTSKSDGYYNKWKTLLKAASSHVLFNSQIQWKFRVSKRFIVCQNLVKERLIFFSPLSLIMNYYLWIYYFQNYFWFKIKHKLIVFIHFIKKKKLNYCYCTAKEAYIGNVASEFIEPCRRGSDLVGVPQKSLSTKFHPRSKSRCHRNRS